MCIIILCIQHTRHTHMICHANIHTHTHAHTHTHTLTHMHSTHSTYTHTHTRTLALILTHTHVHTCTHTLQKKHRTQFWPFLHCLDSKYGIDQDIKSGKKCAESLGMDWDKIDTCATGKQGLDLELMYAKETAALDPPHEYTPWVTINGKVSLDRWEWGVINMLLLACLKESFVLRLGGFGLGNYVSQKQNPESTCMVTHYAEVLVK